MIKCYIPDIISLEHSPHGSECAYNKTTTRKVIMAYPKGDNRIGIKAKQPQSGVKIDSELIKSAIIKSKGNLSRAADSLGCCRQTLYTRVTSEPEIKQVVDTCRERFLDSLEDVFQNKALSGDTTSGLFLLKTIGKKRGYDQDRDIMVEGATRAALDFVMNRSKNPVSS